MLIDLRVHLESVNISDDKNICNRIESTSFHTEHLTLKCETALFIEKYNCESGKVVYLYLKIQFITYFCRNYQLTL